MSERWKDIPNYEGYYQVSNYGRIKSLKRFHVRKDRIRTLGEDSRGYYHVNLITNHKLVSYLVARLVGIAFVSNPLNKPQINHIDGNKLNNHYTNLEWVTGSENMIHAYSINLIKKNGKKILMLSKENEPILCFESLNMACKEMNTYKTGILLCCRGIRHTAAKHKWQFINEEVIK